MRALAASARPQSCQCGVAIAVLPTSASLIGHLWLEPVRSWKVKPPDRVIETRQRPENGRTPATYLMVSRPVDLPPPRSIEHFSATRTQSVGQLGGKIISQAHLSGQSAARTPVGNNDHDRPIVVASMLIIYLLGALRARVWPTLSLSLSVGLLDKRTSCARCTNRARTGRPEDSASDAPGKARTGTWLSSAVSARERTRPTASCQPQPSQTSDFHLCNALH